MQRTPAFFIRTEKCKTHLPAATFPTRPSRSETITPATVFRTP
jgi:hypothetical protein